MKKALCWLVIIGGLIVAGAMAFGEISHRNIEAPLAPVYVYSVQTVDDMTCGGEVDSTDGFKDNGTAGADENVAITGGTLIFSGGLFINFTTPSPTPSATPTPSVTPTAVPPTPTPSP